MLREEVLIDEKPISSVNWRPEAMIHNFVTFSSVSALKAVMSAVPQPTTECLR